MKHLKGKPGVTGKICATNCNEWQINNLAEKRPIPAPSGFYSANLLHIGNLIESCSWAAAASLIVKLKAV